MAAPRIPKYLVVMRGGPVHRYHVATFNNRREAIKWARGYPQWTNISVWCYMGFGEYQQIDWLTNGHRKKES